MQNGQERLLNRSSEWCSEHLVCTEAVADYQHYTRVANRMAEKSYLPMHHQIRSKKRFKKDR